MSGPLCFEDIEVGIRFDSESHRITRADILDFARQFDPQPFHMDEASGENSIFEGLVASGWQTAALTMRLLVQSNPFCGGLVGTEVEVKWKRPTRPNEEITVFTEVVAKETHKSRTDFGWVVIRAETRNARSDVLQVLSSRFMVPTRSASPASAKGRTAACEP